MRRLVLLVVTVSASISVAPVAQTTITTGAISVDGASLAFGTVTKTGKGVCQVQTRNRYPLPDPACTPGAINPSVTIDMLKNQAFETHTSRDRVASLEAKATTYDDYGIVHPTNNTGANQTCELDHLVPIELGGTDTVDNVWPLCGPAGVALAKRYFKIKDRVEY